MSIDDFEGIEQPDAEIPELQVTSQFTDEELEERLPAEMDQSSERLVSLLEENQDALMEGNVSGFVQSLIDSDDYNYDRQQMQSVGLYLVNQRYPKRIREQIFELIVRRRAMSGIEDSSARRDLWSLIDNSSGSLSSLSRRYGMGHVQKCIDSVTGFYEKFERAKVGMVDSNLKSKRRGRGRKTRTYNLPKDIIFAVVLEEHGFDEGYIRAETLRQMMVEKVARSRGYK